LSAYAAEADGYARDREMNQNTRRPAFDALARNGLTGVPRTPPLLRPRFLNYFNFKPEYGSDYLTALSEAIKRGNPRTVGLELNGLDWEYPIWAWFRRQKGPMPIISDIGQATGYIVPRVNSAGKRAFDWIIVQDGTTNAAGWQLIGDSTRVKIYASAGGS